MQASTNNCFDLFYSSEISREQTLSKYSLQKKLFLTTARNEFDGITKAVEEPY
jgi:hypothetical protein